MGDEALLGVEIRRRQRNFEALIASSGTADVKTWKRTLSQLVGDKVVLDPEAGDELIKQNGDATVYEVLNLSKSIPALKLIDDKTKVACDITVLNYGVISTSGFGELFLTYGHAHEAPLGEIYSVLAGRGFLMTYNPANNLSRAIRMEKGDEYLIPPGWTHRFYCGSEGVVLAGFVPHAAGHDYSVVKEKGFPYHIFYDVLRNETIFRRNPAFSNSGLQVVDAQKKPIGAVERYLSAPDQLKALLEAKA